MTDRLYQQARPGHPEIIFSCRFVFDSLKAERNTQEAQGAFGRDEDSPIQGGVEELFVIQDQGRILQGQLLGNLLFGPDHPIRFRENDPPGPGRSRISRVGLFLNGRITRHHLHTAIAVLNRTDLFLIEIQQVTGPPVDGFFLCRVPDDLVVTEQGHQGRLGLEGQCLQVEDHIIVEAGLFLQPGF